MSLPLNRAKVVLLTAWTVTIVVAVFLLYLGADGYTKTKERLVDQASTYAHLIAEHDSFGFFLADFILKDAMEDMTWDDFNGSIKPSPRKDLVVKKLKNHQGRVPSIASFTAVGADGIRRVGIVNKNGTDLSSRTYFKELKAGRDLYISNFEDGLASGKPGIHIARRYNTPNGDFGGLLLINLAAQEFFFPFYESISLGPHVTTSLRDKSRLLIAYPSLDRKIQITADLTLPGISAGEARGVVINTDPMDGLKKVFAYERLQGTGIYAVVGLPISEALNGALRILILAIISAIFLFLGMLAFQEWLKKNIELGDAVKSAELANKERRHLIHRINTVTEDERKYIAAEIHDVLNATVISIKLAAGNIKASVINGPHFAGSGNILRLTEQITNDAQDLYSSGRSIVARLRPEILDVLGLDKAIAEMVGGYNLSHPKCAFKFDCAGEVLQVESDKAIAIYRIVQEALSNSIKHSNASIVTVSLRFTSTHLEIHIVDNGVGIKVDNSSGFGILGMRERAAHIGGIFKIQSHGDHGTDVQILVPLNRPT